MSADNEILRQWIFQYSKSLLRIAHAHTGNWATAEDAVQNAFVKASRYGGTLNDSNAALSWLIRIVINECSTLTRRFAREVVTENAPHSVDRSTEETVIKQERLENIHQAVLGLPVKYRTPIILFYFEDMSVKDIATILGSNAQTIKTRLKRGRERLAHKLQEVDSDGFGGETSRGTGIL